MNITKRVRVEQEIALAQWTDERIAAELGVEPAFVADVRRGMNAACCADVVTPRRRA
jgi:hypothetical protein